MFPGDGVELQANGVSGGVAQQLEGSRAADVWPEPGTDRKIFRILHCVDPSSSREVDLATLGLRIVQRVAAIACRVAPAG
jgi:hypothetical protein